MSFTIDYIDLSNKPKWFLKLSPRGKVPVLVVDETPIFESSALCDFLEEVGPPPALLPEDPVLRARDRGWFALASEDLLEPLYQLGYATTEQPMQQAQELLNKTLARLEAQIEGRNYFSGTGVQFGMADVGMAPFFFRAVKWKQRRTIDLLRDFPRLAAYAQRLCERSSIKNSVSDSFDSDEIAHLKNRGSFLMQGHVATMQ